MGLMSSKWIKNTNILKRHFTEFYNIATSDDFNLTDLQILNDDHNNLIVKRNDVTCYIHSIFDIKREMSQLLGDEHDSEQILIIFGLGMGYCLDYIRERQIKYKRILICEPYNNIFREFLKQRDFSPYLSMKDISFLIFKNPREILPRIVDQVMLSRKIKVLYHLSYRSVFADVFEELNRILSNERLAMQMSTATLNRFLYEWTGNQIKSISKNHISSSVFYKCFENIPAVIISAGPSLEKHIEDLKTIGNKALMFSPGTSAKICKNRDIKSHMAVAMDSQAYEAELLKDSNIKVLIGSYRLHPMVDEVFPNQILRMILVNENIAQYYNEYMNLSVDMIDDHASVSSTAIDYAVRLGCNPIILVGQDMCYYQNRTHADDAEDTIPEGDKANILESKDINGETVYTHPAYLTLRNDMEMVNLKYKENVYIINASEAGLGIPGVDNLLFKKVIQEYIEPQNVDVTEIINNKLAKIDTLDLKYKKDITIFYRHVIDEIEQLQVLNQDKYMVISKIVNMMERGLSNNRITSELHYFEQKNKEMVNNSFYRKVVWEGIKRFLAYYQAGANYEFNTSGDNVSAEIFYQHHVCELTGQYMSFIKRTIEDELNVLKQNIDQLDEERMSFNEIAP